MGNKQTIKEYACKQKRHLSNNRYGYSPLICTEVNWGHTLHRSYRPVKLQNIVSTHQKTSKGS